MANESSIVAALLDDFAEGKFLSLRTLSPAQGEVVALFIASRSRKMGQDNYVLGQFSFLELLITFFRTILHNLCRRARRMFLSTFLIKPSHPVDLLSFHALPLSPPFTNLRQFWHIFQSFFLLHFFVPFLLYTFCVTLLFYCLVT